MSSASMSGHLHVLPRLRRHTCVGSENAAEIERIGGGNVQVLDRPHPGATQPPHPLDRLGQCELFAGKALNEATAADFAAQLERSIDAHQLTPRNAEALALEQHAHHDAVA